MCTYIRGGKLLNFRTQNFYIKGNQSDSKILQLSTVLGNSGNTVYATITKESIKTKSLTYKTGIPAFAKLRGGGGQHPVHKALDPFTVDHVFKHPFVCCNPV
jgi:hypothetical protein